MKGQKRHRFINEVSRFLVGRAFCRKFNYTPLPAEVPDGPFLLFANHNLDYDPFLVSLSFKRQIYYVASEHIFRWGLISALIRWFYAPISKQKGNTDLGTVREIVSRIKDGHNVGIFAEGNRSFDGVTSEISPAGGKLVKMARCTMVTYRLEGGYLTRPRWSKSARRGRMTGAVVQVYTPEQLSGLSVAQINDLIVRDLTEDAYARQEQQAIAYQGKNLAEQLESTLYLCPICGRIGTLKSQEDRFFCTECALACRYTETGFLEGNSPYRTVRDWNVWQQERLGEWTPGEQPFFSDKKMKLLKMTRRHKSRVAAKGSLSMYADRLDCAGQTFALESITAFAIHGQNTLVFTAAGEYYEVQFDGPVCGLKYKQLYELLKGRN